MFLVRKCNMFYYSIKRQRFVFLKCTFHFRMTQPQHIYSFFFKFWIVYLITLDFFKPENVLPPDFGLIESDSESLCTCDVWSQGAS